MTVKDILTACNVNLLADHVAETDYYLNIDKTISGEEKEKTKEEIWKLVKKHIEKSVGAFL